MGSDPLPKAQAISLERSLDELMQHAVLTGDLDPLVSKLDWLIAEDFVAQPRSMLLARQWFHSAIQHDLDPDGPYISFGELLEAEGWCSLDELREGTAERLFVAGTEAGSLPARWYDMLVDFRGKGHFTVLPIDHIRRIESSDASWLITPRKLGD